MPAQTAAQKLRSKTKPFPFTVEGVELTLRRPDIRMLVWTHQIPAPLVEKVGVILSSWIGHPAATIEQNDQVDREAATELLNILVCASCVNPKVVLKLEEVVGDDIMHVEELELDVREKIAVAAMAGFDEPPAAEVAAAQRFPGVQHGEGSSPDVQGVRTETVESGGDPRP